MLTRVGQIDIGLLGRSNPPGSRIATTIRPTSAPLSYAQQIALAARPTVRFFRLLSDLIPVRVGS
jgi:hypothetical protein